MATQPPRSSSIVRVQPKSIIIGTAGHIDHGKTALVRVLTGVDTDRLPEEKRRGITVDLGFASLDATTDDGQPLRLSIVDVPGHARFVRNMLAGAGGIDAVMLVISAEEGVKPQTREHLAICNLLGIEHGLTVLTKIDAVSSTMKDDTRASVERFLANTFLASSPIVAVSARTGFGLDTLLHELTRIAARVPARTEDALPRLPIDRSFVMTGFGTVVTGTLISGSIEGGQELAVEPGNRLVRVRGIQVHGNAEQAAHAGSRTALNLAGVEAAELRRGDTLVQPSTIGAVDSIDAEISLLPDSVPLKHRAIVHFHAFAAECMAAVSLYEYVPVEPGGSRLARLKLRKPIVLLPNDRFVLRLGSPAVTIGGGKILDPNPIVKMPKAKAREWLTWMQIAPSDEQILLRVARRDLDGIPLHKLSVETGLRPNTLRALLSPAITNEKLHWAGDHLLLTHEALTAATMLIVGTFEERGSKSVKRSELRNQTRLGREVFNHALDQLIDDGKMRLEKELVSANQVVDSESQEGTRRLSEMCAAYEQAGLAPPSPDELAKRFNLAPAQIRELITLLLRDRTLVRLGSDTLCVHRSALEELMTRVRSLKGQTIDVSRFKEMTGVSRKYAIPLLECLDRERVTRKVGALRIVT